MYFFTTLLILLIPIVSHAEETRTYTVNSVTFAVPKAALLIDQPSGEKGFSLLLKWPNLSPAGAQEDQSDVVLINIGENRNHTGQIKGLDGELDTSDIIYHNLARWLMSKNGAKYIDNPQPLLLVKNTKYNLDYYKLPRLNDANVVDYDFFIKGDPLNPEIWYACHKIRCETATKLNDHVYLKISHRKDGFITRGLSEKVIAEVYNKITSYIVE